jgi:hypothetical protein
VPLKIVLILNFGEKYVSTESMMSIQELALVAKGKPINTTTMVVLPSPHTPPLLRVMMTCDSLLWSKSSGS